MAIPLATRERPKGGYWVNGTLGRDHYTEGDTVEEARALFLKEHKLTEADVEWLPVEPYPHKPKEPKPRPGTIMGYQRVRLDYDPQG